MDVTCLLIGFYVGVGVGGGLGLVAVCVVCLRGEATPPRKPAPLYAPRLKEFFAHAQDN